MQATSEQWSYGARSSYWAQQQLDEAIQLLDVSRYSCTRLSQDPHVLSRRFSALFIVLVCCKRSRHRARALVLSRASLRTHRFKSLDVNLLQTLQNSISHAVAMVWWEAGQSCVSLRVFSSRAWAATAVRHCGAQQKKSTTYFIPLHGFLYDGEISGAAKKMARASSLVEINAGDFFFTQAFLCLPQLPVSQVGDCLIPKKAPKSWRAVPVYVRGIFHRAQAQLTVHNTPKASGINT